MVRALPDPQLTGLTDADDRQLAALGLWLADDLERRLETHSGIIRQLARRLVELSPRDKPPGGCPVCGQDVPENTRGRPRTYCSTRCKNAARSKVSEMSNWE